MEENFTETNFLAVVEPDHQIDMTIEQGKKLLEDGLRFIENVKELPGIGDERCIFRIGITVHPSGKSTLCSFGVVLK